MDVTVATGISEEEELNLKLLTQIYAPLIVKTYFS